MIYYFSIIRHMLTGKYFFLHLLVQKIHAEMVEILSIKNWTFYVHLKYVTATFDLLCLNMDLFYLLMIQNSIYSRLLSSL